MYDASRNLQQGKWRGLVGGDQGSVPIDLVKGYRYSNKAIKTRNAIEDFVNSEEGSVIWQEEYVARTSYDREDTTNEQELIISAC